VLGFNVQLLNVTVYSHESHVPSDSQDLGFVIDP